ncbi:hypothetical protein [Candidatus Mycalebacterium sp.]
MKLDGFPGERSIIDVDSALEPNQLGRRCDYIIIVDEGENTFFLPVEFKRTNLNFIKIKEQLEGGIQSFKEHLKQFICYPVLVSKSLRGQERKKLRKIQIDCGNQGKKRITHVRCNNLLSWKKIKKAP